MLDELVAAARETIQSGYYRPTGSLRRAPSLRKAIQAASRKPAVLAEIKPATPTRGKLVEGGIEALMDEFLRDGAVGLSVLTEPKHFHGSLKNLRTAVFKGAPVLMKDFVLAEEQIDCAAHLGASAVLLIASILTPERAAELIEYARLAEREVLLEVATPEEYRFAVGTNADLVGINNRDLRSFEVDIDRTIRIARAAPKRQPIVSLSAFESRKEVERVAGVADAVLVGSSLVERRTTVKELIGA